MGRCCLRGRDRNPSTAKEESCTPIASRVKSPVQGLRYQSSTSLSLIVVSIIKEALSSTGMSWLSASKIGNDPGFVRPLNRSIERETRSSDGSVDIFERSIATWCEECQNTELHRVKATLGAALSQGVTSRGKLPTVFTTIDFACSEGVRNEKETNVRTHPRASLECHVFILFVNCFQSSFTPHTDRADFDLPYSAADPPYTVP